MNRTFIKLTFITLCFFLSSCSKFVRQTHIQNEVLIEGIDVEQSIIVATKKLAEHKLGSALGFWALRDQIISPENAQDISDAYLLNIANVEKDFDIWHLTWAISNFYRSGSQEVQENLQLAYDDAVQRAIALDKRAAKTHVLGEEIHRGFYHRGGWKAAKVYLVVPGNELFLQNSEDN